MGGYANQAHTTFQRLLIGDGALEMRLPQAWSLRKNVSFESETYTATAGEPRIPLFLIYLGNNPAFDSIQHDRVTVGALHGNAARRYFSRDLVTDVVVMPKCGRDKYIWLKRISTRHESYAAIVSAFETMRCASRNATKG